MRCLECNVDLGENVKTCPLCGSKAADEAPVLEGMHVAEYPEYGELRPLKYYIKKNDVYFGKYMMWAILGIAVAVLIVSACLDALTLAVYTILPVFFAVSAVVYFVTSLTSEKNGVKSAIYLIALAVFDLIIVAVGYIVTKEVGTVYYALGSALVSLLGLMILAGKYPKETDAELGGRFHH